MKENCAAIALIVDRSGSMGNVVDDTIGGVNSFINKQREEDGEAYVTLVQFDNEIETIHDYVNINDVPELTSNVYFPRGMTSLYDAIGITSVKLGQRLAQMAEEDRPERVIVAIITDGAENCSKEYTRDGIKSIIKEQEEKYKWDYNFISADLSSYNDARKMGFAAGKTALYSTCSTASTFDALSCKASRYRSADVSQLADAGDFQQVELQSMIGNNSQS